MAALLPLFSFPNTHRNRVAELEVVIKFKKHLGGLIGGSDFRLVVHGEQRPLALAMASDCDAMQARSLLYPRY